MLVEEFRWKEEERCGGEDIIFTAHTKIGRFTVLDRLTGFGIGIRDIETGYMDFDGEFWIVSGMFDIRKYSKLTETEAAELTKRESV